MSFHHKRRRTSACSIKQEGALNKMMRAQATWRIFPTDSMRNIFQGTTKRVVIAKTLCSRLPFKKKESTGTKLLYWKKRKTRKRNLNLDKTMRGVKMEASEFEKWRSRNESGKKIYRMNEKSDSDVIIDSRTSEHMGRDLWYLTEL